MAIYTKTGDRGETSLFGGRRVKKYDPQVDASGHVDELSCALGVVISKIKNESDIDLLTHIQRDLYEIMTVLSGAQNTADSLTNRVDEFEEYIDRAEKSLPELHRFILPQGAKGVALMHLARSVCRRSERGVVLFLDNSTLDQKTGDILIRYLNRLSDLLFMMARKYNTDQEITV